ncbi:hypothetical protein [uncultured Campylobacter sp.]|uniref:hypothetical protein n=1 Tax=uncultured Campylobacter sp. TaxID=218934 RepID=UPI002623B90D|nr:hypothetical protein [uncultured Campylobacter sp.]
MEFYRNVGFWRGSKILSRLEILHGAAHCAKAANFYHNTKFCRGSKIPYQDKILNLPSRK